MSRVVRRQAVLDVQDQLLLHLLPPFRQSVGVQRDHGERAGAPDDVGHLGEVRQAVSTRAPRLAEHPDGVMGHAADLFVHGNQPVEIRRPGDLPALDRRRLHRAGELARVDLIRERGSIVGAGHRREHERDVGDGARDRPDDPEGVPGQRPRIGRDQTRRGAEADDAAVSRRDSERATEVGSHGDRPHAGGHGHRGAAARAARGERGIPRIARGAEDRIEGVPAGAELGRVRLAHHDGPGRLETLDHEVVCVGNVVLVDERAPRRANPLGREQVLDRHRHAVERGQRR